MLVTLQQTLSRRIGQRLYLLYYIAITENSLAHALYYKCDYITFDEQLTQLKACLTYYKAELANIDLVIVHQHLGN